MSKMKSHTRGKVVLVIAALIALIVLTLFGTGAYIVCHFVYKAIVLYW